MTLMAMQFLFYSSDQTFAVECVMVLSLMLIENCTVKNTSLKAGRYVASYTGL